MTKPGSQHHPTIEALKNRVARDPFSRAFLQLAEEYRKEGRFREAIEVCREGLQRHPTDHTARIALGRTHMEAGDVENARRVFVEVLDLQPENHLAAKLLAEIQKKTGDPGGAAATYRAILRYYPDDREVAALLQESLHQGPVPTAPAPGSSAVEARAAGPSSASPLQPPRTGVPIARPSDPSPDFRPEDLGGAPFPANRETWSAPAGLVAGPDSGPPRDDQGEPEDDALQTNTLAEVYLRQGLVDRAIEVYRGMLRVDPGNQKAAGRLSELEPGSAQGPASTPAEPLSGSGAMDGTAPSSPAPEPVEIPAVPVSSARDDGGGRRETIRRLERWLLNVSGGATRGAPQQ